MGEGYENQDTPEWKPVLAELATDAIVRRLMEGKYPSGAEARRAELDIDMYGRQRSRARDTLTKLVEVVWLEADGGVTVEGVLSDPMGRRVVTAYPRS